jgi:WD40 repeat protein
MKEQNQKTLQIKDRSFPVIDLQWDQLSSIYILIAYSSFLSLWDTETCTEVHSFEKQGIGISSIAWMSWTAGNFVSTNNKTGILKVWNASQKQPLDSIKVGESGIATIYIASGSKRAICACLDGSIVVYHIEKRQIEYKTAASHTETIFDTCFSPHSCDVVATASYDQTVKLWSVSDLSLTKTLYGADSIIYSCDWSPKGDMIACSTAIGTVQIWDVESGRELVRYLHHTKAVYCVSWNKMNPNIIASTSADGLLVVFEIDVEELCNPHSSQIATGSRKKPTPGTKPKGNFASTNMRLKFNHPAQVFGCSWCNDNYISTGCQDGIVRIFNFNQLQIVYSLCGHKARSFNTIWSTTNPGYLASGSDDQTICIWKVPINDNDKLPNSLKEGIILNPVNVLVGHTSNVRALCWCYEHKNLLLSGSWDSSIRLWDVQSGECLASIKTHVADVYAITSHPDRPFTFLSCSRDTTCRLWELKGIFTKMRLSSVYHCSLLKVLDTSTNLDNFQSNSYKNYNKVKLNKSTSSLLPCLSGRKSLALNVTLGDNLSEINNGIITQSRVQDHISKAQKYYRLFNFFSGANGCMDIWEQVLQVLYLNSSKNEKIDDNVDNFHNNSPPTPLSLRSSIHRIIFHENEIVNKAKAKARKLESSKMVVRRGDMSGKVEEQLRQSFLTYATTGDISKCCSILIDLNEWTSAIALAPSVSIEYWRELTIKYSQYLMNLSSEQCVPHLVAVGHDAEAVDFYLRRKDSYNALVISKMSEDRKDLIPANFISNKDKNNNSQSKDFFKNEISPIREKTVKEIEDSRTIVKAVSLQIANNYLYASRPMLAAAQHIAVLDIPMAISVLSMVGEYDIAYALCDCFGLETDSNLISMAYQCADLFDIELAISILSTLKTGEIEVGLFLNRYINNKEEIDCILEKNCFKVSSDWINISKEEEEIGSDAEAVIYNVIGSNHEKAVSIGLTYLTRYIKEPIDLSNQSKKLIRGLKFINVVALDENNKNLFLCYILWFTSHEAAELGMWEISWNMLRILRKTKYKSFPISIEQLSYHELCIRITAGDLSSFDLIHDLLSLSDLSPIINESIQSLRNLLRQSQSSDGGNIQSNNGSPSKKPISLQSHLNKDSNINEVWGANTTNIYRY